MNLRMGAVLLAVAALGWWFSPLSPRVPAVAAHVPGDVPRCPLPPAVRPGDPPLQGDVPGDLAPFRLQAATLVPLAAFSVDARVLSREDYRFDREAELSPTDLALGWGRMDDDAVLNRLAISQSSRWYRYRWRGDPPLPPDEIVRSSANMHMIPANPRVADALQGVRTGAHVRIDGWLVEAEAPDGARWRSSLTRDDSGSGACEVVYVCAITTR
ncbi:MAG: hypothetical protein ACTHKZ_05160 [Lysobacteraceae bacterium]